MSNNSKTINLLIDKAKRENQKAYSELLNIFWEDVFIFIISRGINREDAEDFCILSFSKAFDNLDQFNNNKSFKSWIFKIAQNSIIDNKRKKQSVFFKQDIKNKNYLDIVNIIPSKDLTPEENFISTEKIDIINKAVKNLPLKYKKVIELRILYEKKYSEISEILNIPRGTVKVLLYRGRALLLKLLEN